MINIVYPDKTPALRSVDGRKEVFCLVRKRWIKLTPEEWVRQNFIHYLVYTLGYPLALISVERNSGGEVYGRFDIVVFRNDRPFMLVECKEMKVPLTTSVISQVLGYNIPVKSSIIVITNGNHTYAWQVIPGGTKELAELPVW